MKSYIIYPDGGADPNPGPGGYGCVITTPATPNVCIRQGYVLTTNNRMELRGVIAGLAAIEERAVVHVKCDSKYVVKGATLWLAGWKSHNWTRPPAKGSRDRQPLLNADLWKQLDAQLARHVVSIKWLKGHNGDPNNERADQLTWEARERDLILDEGMSCPAWMCQRPHAEPCLVHRPVLFAALNPCNGCEPIVRGVIGKVRL